MPLTYEERNEPRVDEVLLNEGHAFLRKKRTTTFFCIFPFAFRSPLPCSSFSLKFHGKMTAFTSVVENPLRYIPFSGIIFFNE